MVSCLFFFWGGLSQTYTDNVADYKVTNAEGFGKIKLFEILDDLEKGTRPIMANAREELACCFGKDALEPWNTSFKMSGSMSFNSLVSGLPVTTSKFSLTEN